MTRREMSIQINLLERRASNSSNSTLKAALAALGYLYATRNEWIILTKPTKRDLRIFADATYGGEYARSQTGVLITL